MRDFNICEHCNLYFGLTAKACSRCRQPLVLDSRGAVQVWRLGDVEDGVLGPVMAGIRRIFGRQVVLQPAYLDERPSVRGDDWSGLSAATFLNQVARRHRSSTYLSLGVTERNVVTTVEEAFLFGLGFETSAVMSLHPLREDGASDALVAERAVKIAAHELGHGLGLDHHAYDDDGIDCVMVGGDLERESVETVDEGTARFCRECRVALG